MQVLIAVAGFYSGHIYISVLLQMGKALVKQISCLSPRIGPFFTLWSSVGAPELDFKMKLGWKMHSRSMPNAHQLQTGFQSMGAG